MSLDKFLSNLSVKVAPFALCEVARGWRLKLPAPPGIDTPHAFREGAGECVN